MNLSETLLEEFKISEASEFWTGDVEKKGLFEYWLKITKAAGNKVINKPIIKSIEQLVNHKVIVLEECVKNDVTVESVNENILPVSDSVILETSFQPDEILVDSSIEPINETVSCTNECVLPVSDTEILLEANFEETISAVVNVNINPSRNETVLLENNIISNESLDSIILDNIESFEIANEEAPIDLSNNNWNINSSNAENTLSAIVKGTNNKQNINYEVLRENVLQKHTCKPNNEEHINQEVNENLLQTSASFAKAFTLPVKYLPRKKRVKLEAKGKPKLPSVGTSEKWWQAQFEKEKQQQLKEDKALRKRKLLEEKKQLAEEKQKLQEKMNAIKKKIKSEVA